MFAAEFRDRIDETIRRVVEHAHAGDNPPSHPDSSPPAAAAAAGGGPAMAAGVPAMAGLATGSGTADALVSRLQSLVRTASQSNRLPRWLRRLIPHDAGPGASVAIAAAAVAAVVVLVVVIAAIASALTSGSPSSQAGPGGSTSVAGAPLTLSVGSATSRNLHLNSASCFNSSRNGCRNCRFALLWDFPRGLRQPPSRVLLRP